MSAEASTERSARGLRRQRKFSKDKQLDRKLKVLVLTWNVGNAAPDAAELREWLEEGGGDLDLIVVGTQENAYNEKKGKKGRKSRAASDAEPAESTTVRTSVAEAQPSRQSSRAKHQGWERMIRARLGDDWTTCAHRVLWEMRLSVFCHRGMLRGGSMHNALRVHHVQTSSAACGIGGVMGNKGGLVAKLGIGCQTLCFVSCHLAAHTEHLERRNQDCQQILRDTSHRVGNRWLDGARAPADTPAPASPRLPAPHRALPPPAAPQSSPSLTTSSGSVISTTASTCRTWATTTPSTPRCAG